MEGTHVTRPTNNLQLTTHNFGRLAGPRMRDRDAAIADADGRRRRLARISDTETRTGRIHGSRRRRSAAVHRRSPAALLMALLLAKDVATGKETELL